MTAALPRSPRTRPRYFYTVVSVSLVLFLLGLFGLILVQGRTLIRLAKESVDLIAELKPDTGAAALAAVRQRIEAHPAVKPGSLRVTTKAEAAELMREELGAELTELGLDNPFFDVISFNVRESYLGPDSLAALRADLRTLGAINDIYYQESLVGDVGRNLRRITWVGGILGVLLLGVTLLLIHNTVRLALHANRRLIRNMQLVGATWGFITRPYLLRSLWNGLLSGLLAVLLLGGVLLALRSQVPDVVQLYDYTGLTLLFGLLIVLGIAVSTGSTYAVVRRYLHLRNEAIY